MTNLFATIALLTLVSPHAHAADTVRVGLFSLFNPEVLDLRIASGEGATLDVYDLSGSRRVTRGDSVRVRLSGTRLSVTHSTRGGHERIALASGVRVVPVGSATFELVLPGKIRRTVRGTVLVEADGGGGGRLKIVLTTSREAAVAAVVAAETSEREPEALKALSIVVRTFMISQAGRHSNEGFDFCDTTHCQLYRGEQDLMAASRALSVLRAVGATEGQYLSFEGAPVDAHYTAVCGGISATPSIIWGGSERYPYRRIACRWCEASRFARWARSAPVADVLRSLSRSLGSSLPEATELITESDETGVVRSVVLKSGTSRRSVSGDAFRRAIGSRLGWNTVLSPTFTVERRGSKFIFRGRGFGSQVGLCEAGAFAQAAAGRSYKEILSFYYPLASVGEAIHD